MLSILDEKFGQKKDQLTLGSPVFFRRAAKEQTSG
jgi:hypothetical protein